MMEKGGSAAIGRGSIGVSIYNSASEDREEDRITTQVKPFLYVAEMKGMFRNAKGQNQDFDSITVQCYPEG
jgi:hypothetical protein